MSKVQSQLPCPGCKSKTAVAFKKPALFCPTLVTFDCGECGSTVLIKISKPSKGGMGQVSILPIRIRPSPLLLEMEREEAEHKAKSVEEQGGS